ncbi:hypothetical protein GCM10027275_25030 [Rhabdobacter roseus]|uniref:Uncharacterized protein n=1 Tax=Rhabdobacter roseus TaxID=1655419 RepID=A0A840TT48_9BACT|nr:hypothetical protein [Rhabdobacter roseus]MBB5284443.1 hypothetical protein [Rhabdobacter roseus]
MEATEKNQELEREIAEYEKSRAELWGNVSELVIAICQVSIGLQINGFLIYQLWKWIIVPTYGVEPITVGQGFGVGIFLALFRGEIPSLKKGNKRITVAEYRHRIRYSLQKLALFLLLGWLASLFV